MSTEREPESSSHEDLEQFPTVTERKYKVKRFRRRYGEVEFFVCEIWKPGAPKPSASVLHRTDADDLAGTTREATRLVNVMVRNGGKVPREELGADLIFDTDPALGFAGLNPRSATGKPQWCEEHWRQIEGGMVGRTHNGVVAGMLLTSVFLEQIKAQGVLQLPEAIDDYTMTMLRDSYSPLCCWLGQTVVDEVLFASRVEEIEKSGLLQAFARGRAPK